MSLDKRSTVTLYIGEAIQPKRMLGIYFLNMITDESYKCCHILVILNKVTLVEQHKNAVHWSFTSTLTTADKGLNYKIWEDLSLVAHKQNFHS